MSDETIHQGLDGVVVDTTSISKVMPEINSLVYRGYPVQELAEHCSFEEVAWLIWHGGPVGELYQRTAVAGPQPQRMRIGGRVAWQREAVAGWLAALLVGVVVAAVDPHGTGLQRVRQLEHVVGVEVALRVEGPRCADCIARPQRRTSDRSCGEEVGVTTGRGSPASGAAVQQPSRRTTSE